MDDRALLATAERLYAAVAAPELWPGALDGIVALVRGGHGFLHEVGEDNPLYAYAGVDERDIARLNAPDVIRMTEPFFQRIPAGVAWRGELISDAEFSRSQYYNEVVRPLGGFHSVHLRIGGATVITLTACRPHRAENFSAGEAAMLRAIEPHLGTAIALRRRLGLAEQRAEGLARTLDRADAGVIVLDQRAQPVFLNARAARIAAESDGLNLDRLGLAGATATATRRLRDAILAVTRQQGNGHNGDLGGAEGVGHERQLILERPSGRPPLLLSVLPIWRLGCVLPGVRLPHVAIFITEPDVPGAVDRQALIETFRLTPREGDVAWLLASGCDLDTIAARLGLGPATVRFHLKHVLQKTDTHSQAALVARLRGFVHPSAQ